MISTRRAARRQRYLLAALVLFGGAVSSAPAVAQLTVSPAEIVLIPGTTPAASFLVANDGFGTIQATLYQNDWDRNDDGENAFHPLGTQVGSCGDRVQTFPSILRLDAGGRQSVRVSIEGGDFPSPCWTIVFVESAPRASTAQSRVVYVTRIGVKVYVLPTGLSADAEITGFAVEKRRQVPSGPAVDTTQDELALRIRNSGGLPTRFSGQVEYRDLQNRVAATVKIEDFPVLPGATRRVAIELPRLAPGRYVALAVLGFGGDDDLAAQLEVDVR